MASLFGDVVRALLAEGVGGLTTQRDLARRLQELRPRRALDDGWRRDVTRWLDRNDPVNPTEKTIVLVARAFGVEREQFPESERLTLRALAARLQQAEVELAALAQEAKDLAVTLEDLVTRVSALERRGHR